MMVTKRERPPVRAGLDLGDKYSYLCLGPLTALTFVLTLEDPYRFEKSRSVGAYLGLVPATDRSGDRDPHRRISKEGEEMLSVSSW
jgi:hypothetical protein